MVKLLRANTGKGLRAVDAAHRFTLLDHRKPIIAWALPDAKLPMSLLSYSTESISSIVDILWHVVTSRDCTWADLAIPTLVHCAKHWEEYVYQ